MLDDTFGWSHARGNEVVPSPWQATPLIDPRRLHRHRAVGRDHLPIGVVAIANHQSVTVVVDFTGMSGDGGAPWT